MYNFINLKIKQEFGTLVMTLYFVIKDIIVWILAYIAFWIPFTSSFYMLYGNRKICPNGSIDTCGSNLTVVDDMESYNKVAFILYSVTFGADIPRDDLNKVDDIMTDILVGTYIGVTTLLMVNIFIALLTSTFSRVHDSSKAYFILQRAMEILRVENRLSVNKKFNHLIKLRDDYVDKSFSAFTEISSSTIEDKFEPVKDSMKEMRHEIDSIYDKLENVEVEMVILRSLTLY